MCNSAILIYRPIPKPIPAAIVVDLHSGICVHRAQHVEHLPHAK
jgi:hypothetical protein